jgi:isoleucyl-tRNA synthetase
VSLDTTVTDELVLEAQARELIHAIQQLRKDAGLEFTDTITLSLSGAEKIMEVHRELILEETRAVLGDASGDSQTVDLGGADVGIRFKKN